MIIAPSVLEVKLRNSFDPLVSGVQIVNGVNISKLMILTCYVSSFKL